MKKCTVEGCENKHEAKGFCKKHYRAYKKYGDPLAVKKKQNLKYDDNHKYIDNVECKLCIDCNEWKIMNEYYYKNKSNKIDGFNSYCIECTKDRNLKYYFDNKDERSKQKHEYYEKNKVQLLKQQRDYRKENWDKKQKYFKEWQNQNKDKLRTYNVTRKMNKDHYISKKEWDRCLAYFGNSCAYCGISEDQSLEILGQRLHKEHVHHEGGNDLSNNIPACKTCNSRKWKYKFMDWYNEKNEVYSVERYEKIIYWLHIDYINFIDNIS